MMAARNFVLQKIRGGRQYRYNDIAAVIRSDSTNIIYKHSFYTSSCRFSAINAGF